MQKLPRASTDAEIIAFVDRWAALLEREDFQAAYELTDHVPGSAWTADLIEYAIKAYGEPGANNRVTVSGLPTDVVQHKDVVRRPRNERGYVGYVWYDLNLNGLASDLTATFELIETPDGLSIQLSSIHVM